jgi:ubiquinone/menaquinone biosynthesis C-methylase UbiE
MVEAAEFWDKMADRYAKSPIGDMPAYTYTLDRTRSYLSKSDHVLELGCGTGSTALLLAENAGKITASDVSQNMIRIGQKKAQDQGITNVGFVAADLFDPALDKGSYDAILALNLLHLLPGVPQALARIHSRLKPGGLFISKTFCRPTPGAKWNRRLMTYYMMRVVLPVMQFIGKAPLVSFMTIEQLEGRITAAGFDIIETGNYPANPPNRYIVARKASG